ncbi:MAG: hypothetical protein JSR33_13795 [Proteobacteria bacterium]|nr:hypothetical protein [Pseudomonadota bacterium]
MKAAVSSLLKHPWIRTLRIDILTLFISLITIAFILVISYSYYQNYQAILNYSRGTMERNSTAIMGDINDLQKRAIGILQDSVGLFIDNRTISIQDRQVQLYLLNSLKINSDFSSIFIAFSDGRRITVKRASAYSQTHFIAQPAKLLPQNTIYSVNLLDPKQNPPETWYYTDSAFRVIAQNTAPLASYLVKDRPWYRGALTTRNIFWTEPYYFANTQDLGLTAIKPIYNSQNQLMAMIGVDISFLQLSSFVMQEKIGKYGQTFIIDAQDQIVAPTSQKMATSKISATVVQRAVNLYNQKKQNNFSFVYKHARYLSYVGVLPAIFDKHWLIVTIVPFANLYSGLITTQLKIILISLLILLFAILIIIYFSKRISNPINELSQEIDKVTNLYLSSKHRVNSSIVEIRRIDASVAAMRSAMRSFSRYVPKEVVKQLLALGKDITLHVDKKKITVFFSDIQDFTAIVETHSLKTLMPLLNEYFDGLSKIILENNGTIDKYIGDSIMAFWGAPLDDPQHAISACKTALFCQAFLQDLNQTRIRKNQPVFYTRFGLSSGSVVVGNIGTTERMNYTVLGDIVNIAARLQVTNKIYQTHILIGDGVFHHIDGLFLTRPLDTVAVKGKKKTIKIYELVALQGADPKIGANQNQKELCRLFTEAYDFFVQGNLQQAKIIFERIITLYPDDLPTKLYLERLTK